LPLLTFRPASGADTRLAGKGRRKARRPSAVEDIPLGERHRAGSAVERDRNNEAGGLALQLRHFLDQRFRRTVGGEALDVNSVAADTAVDEIAIRPHPSSDPVRR
jgi:hypothetical protein